MPALGRCGKGYGGRGQGGRGGVGWWTGGAMAQLALQRSASFSAGEESELVVVV